MKKLRNVQITIFAMLLSLIGSSLAQANPGQTQESEQAKLSSTDIQPASNTAPLVTKEVAREAFNRYNQLIQVEPGWTGNVEQCVAGSVSPEYMDASLEAVNLFRGLAGMQPVTFDPRYNHYAQEAALVMKANNDLSHHPDDSWKCNSEDAKLGARKSNLHISFGGKAGPQAVFGYLEDDGDHNTRVGHRRWLMMPNTQVMGFGDSGNANALYLIDTESDETRMTTQWPLAGYFPVQWNTTRWSYSTDGAFEYDLTSVQVTVHDQNGRNIPLTQYPPSEGVGNDTIVWELGEELQGFGNRENTYNVTVSNMRTKAGDPISNVQYQVTLFDPTYVYSKPAVRWSGPERISTAVQVSRANFADNSGAFVHIATAGSYPDALVGAAAASWRDGPVLLTNTNSLPAEVEAEIRRLKPRAVAILGGTAAVSEKVRKQISRITGKYTHRFSGPDRYSTSVVIADQTYGNPSSAILVNGNDFGEALSATNLFAYNSSPVFLINPAVPTPTPGLLKELNELTKKEILVLNGGQRVPDSIVQNLRGRGFNVTVIDGKDKYDANLQAAKYTYSQDLSGWGGIPKERTVYFVTGEKYPDGLAIGAIINHFRGPVMFVKDGCIRPEAEEFLQDLSPSKVVVVGGKNAVPDGIERFPVCQ